MPRVVIFAAQVFEGNKLFDTELYEQAYTILAKQLNGLSVDLSFARGMDAFTGAGTFVSGWHFQSGAWEAATEPFVADLLYNKAVGFRGDGKSRILNDPELQDVCSKDATYALFPDVSPKSVVVSEKQELDAKLKELRTEKVIGKPLDLYGGKGIVVASRDDIERQELSYPCIIQEFIDTSAGIPGIAKGKHDLRVMMLGDRMSDCYVRTPAEGSELSNTALGGTMNQVSLDDVPQGAKDLVRSVDARLTRFPDRAYSIDMGLVDGKDWYLFELNAPPGTPTPVPGRNVEPYLKALAEHLAKHIRA